MEKQQNQFDETFDVLVVGSGCGGLTAALTADIASCSITSAPIGPKLGKGKKPADGPTNSSAQVLPLARRTN